MNIQQNYIIYEYSYATCYEYSYVTCYEYSAELRIFSRAMKIQHSCEYLYVICPYKITLLVATIAGIDSRGCDARQNTAGLNIYMYIFICYFI